MNKIMRNMRNSKKLSKYACHDKKAMVLMPEEEDIRTRFFRDADRIIYSLSYTRYIDKTQVFTFTENDNISKRITHVQYVSKIARTIGRALALNEDLIEAAALGHDLGHPPFGHCGEKALNELSLKYNEGFFGHNIQSVRTLMSIEDNGKGKNISVQVLDAILCHNGEMLSEIYSPVSKTKEDFLRDYENSYKDKSVSLSLKPMTLEGCVVRVSDVIGYVGRDVEDAIRLGIINIDDVPLNVRNTLGSSNREIVNTLVLDIIDNSIDKPYIKMSTHIFKALKELMDFNYRKIYNVINDTDEIREYDKMYKKLFEVYLSALEHKKLDSDIYTIFLNDMSDKYINSTSNVRKVIDYIAGMTDDFFISRYNAVSNIKVKR